jgi:hypothetical protein
VDIARNFSNLTRNFSPFFRISSYLCRNLSLLKSSKVRKGTPALAFQPVDISYKGIYKGFMKLITKALPKAKTPQHSNPASTRKHL